VQLGGCTLHSFAGVGIPKRYKDFNKMWKRKREWRRVCVLLVDEVSMLSGSLLDAFDATVRKIRNIDAAFGFAFCSNYAGRCFHALCARRCEKWLLVLMLAGA